MLRNNLFGECNQFTVGRVQTGFTINLPSCFKKVDNVNTFIQSIGDKSQYLDQNEITHLYNKWSPQDQEKFIWKGGVKPSFDQKSSPRLSNT